MSKRLLGLLVFGIWLGSSGIARATVTPDPTTLDFGSIAINTTKDLQVTLSADVQTGNITLAVGGEAGCTEFIAPAGTFSVGPPPPDGTGSQTVTIQFAPTTGGDKTCTINVKQGSTTLATIPASGHAEAPKITLTPAPNQTLDFGHVDAGDQSTTALTITAKNDGQVPLTITSASLITGSGEFTVTGPSSTTVQPTTTATWNLKCKPTDRDTRSGTFRIVSDSSVDSTADVSLTCIGDQGAVTTTAASNDFGLVQLTTMQRPNSKQLTFQVTNTGNVAITNLNNVTGVLSPTNKGYSVTTDAPTSLGVGGSATYTVTFAPGVKTDGGNGSLNIAGHWGNGKTVTPSFAFTGAAGDVSITTATLPATPLTALAFGNFRFDSHPARTYRIFNNGLTAITLASADVVPDVQPTSTAELPTTFTAGSLAAGGHVDVAITAQFNRAGAFGAHIDVVTNVAGASLRVDLTGTSQAAVVTATAMADFGAVDIDVTPSPTQTVTLKNTGDATLNFSLAPMAGASPAFTFSGLPPSGGSTLAPQAQINVVVTYHPTIEKPAGQSDAAVLVAGLTGVVGLTSQTISVQGRGIDRHMQVDAAPTFPPVFRNPGDQAPIRPVTVHNTGDAVLKIKAVMVSSQPAGLELLDTAAVDIPAHGSQDFRVKFAPSTVGAVTGSLTLIDDDNARPMASVALTGTCQDRMISFGPQTIDLGFTALGIPIDADGILAVTNLNQQDFKIHQILLEDDSVFHIDNAPRDAALPGGAKQTFSITFAPTSINKFTTTAHLLIDQDPTGESMDVLITGRAVFAEAHGSGGCSAGGGGGGLVLGLLALALPGLQRRRRRRPATLAAAAATVMLAAPAARADGIDATVFAPTPATTGEGFALQTPEVGASGSWVASAVVSYASNPLVLSFPGDGGRSINDALVGRSTLLQVGAAFALFDRLELGAHLPIYQQSGEPGPTGQPAHGTATGNLALHAKARLLRAPSDAGTLIVGASVIAVVPTATKDQFTGSDQPEGRLLLLGSFIPAAIDGRLTLSVNGGPVLRGTSQYANLEQKSAVAWGAGASFRVLDELWATAELFGESTPGGQRREAMGEMVALSPVEGLAGFVFRPDPMFSIGLAAGRGMTDAAGTPEVRGVLSLSIVPGGHALAPIRTEVDRSTIDSDGDGIPDSVDKCPNEPEDKDMFEDQDGCPDPDNDHDGIPDIKDKCPLDAEDKDGFQDDDGCPDPDNDHDGIPDAMDKCPNDPEDKDGFEDLDGCPDADNDHDGIPDTMDRCPNEPETINGFQDDDGCPDRGDSMVIVSPDRIETLDPVQFTGLKLTRTGLSLLGQVGATLRAHPEILRLRITVHVQPTDNPEADQARSDKRAQAIRDWLIQWGTPWGVGATRLDARGFGGTKPLVSPDQRGAAKINDRIEFIILERK
jgi:hypothetical protein